MIKLKNTSSLVKAILLASFFVSPAFFATSAFAGCGGSLGRYEAPVSSKPVIEFGALTPDQLAVLDTYAAAVKAAAKASRDAYEALPAARTDRPGFENGFKEANAKFRAALLDAESKVPFRTLITVGNGMLCGAAIEVQVPPNPDNMEATLDSIDTYGKDRSGGRARGVISAGYLPEIFADLKKKSSK